MKPLKLKMTFPLFAIILLMGCSTSSNIVGTWKKTEGKVYNFDRIAILGIAHNAETRKLFETALEERMLRKGFPAEAALDFLPPNANEDNISPEIVHSILQSSDVDAVMTIHLLRIDDTRRFVPDRMIYEPYYVTYTFTDHHTEVHEYVMVSGYFTGELDVFLEANLFDFSSGELIWAAQTETVDLSQVSDVASSFSSVLVEDLVKSSVIQTKYMD